MHEANNTGDIAKDTQNNHVSPPRKYFTLWSKYIMPSSPAQKHDCWATVYKPPTTSDYCDV